MRHISNPVAIEIKSMKTDFRTAAVAIVGYLIISSFTSIIFIFFTGAEINGAAEPVAAAVGLVFVWLCCRNEFRFRSIFNEYDIMTRGKVINLLACLLAFQPVFQLLEHGIQSLFEHYDKTITFGSSDPYTGGTVFVLLSTVVFGPLAEELIFRGFLLRFFRKYGRMFAIIASSIFFAFCHTNFIQFGHSFACGLILAYAAMRYSIAWSIVLHCLHNLLVTIVALLNVPWYLNYGFFAIFFIWGCIYLIANTHKAIRFTKSARRAEKAYSTFFTSPYVLGYIVITIVLAVLTTKIGVPGAETTATAWL